MYPPLSRVPRIASPFLFFSPAHSSPPCPPQLRAAHSDPDYTPYFIWIHRANMSHLPLGISRQGFGRGGNNKKNGSPTQTPAPPTPQGPASISNSPTFASSQSIDGSSVNDADAPKYFFQEKYAPLNVRGNFLTLCACPKNVELGEWLAHQSK